MTIIEYKNRLQLLTNPTALELMLFEEIRRCKSVFVRYNKEQLSKGEDNKGDVFGEYSPLTQQIASFENPRKPKIAGQPYNFEYTGGLFDGFELQVKGTEAQFWSTDSKTPMLVAKYEGLFGLQPDNLREIIKTLILPAFLLQLRKILGLK